MIIERPTGRRKPSDWLHVEKYPVRMRLMIALVNKTLALPYQYRAAYDQGAEGACVGFGGSWMTSIHNTGFFDARWLYQRAQFIDEWADTPPEEGTSVRAAMDILRTVGHRRVFRGKVLEPDLRYGILENRWATTVDEMRTAIADGRAVTIGVNWYANFDAPVKKSSGWWIGEGDLRRIRGGHCVCVYGASDKFQAFRIVNNWGKEYPTVLMPYNTMQRLLNEDGEATLITDAV